MLVRLPRSRSVGGSAPAEQRAAQGVGAQKSPAAPAPSSIALRQMAGEVAAPAPQP